MRLGVNKPHIQKNARGAWGARLRIDVLFSDAVKDPAFIERLQAAQSFVWRLNRAQACEDTRRKLG